MKGLYMATMGLPKVKKTIFAISVFKSEYLDPDKVLYCDNHESTLGHDDLPAYNRKTNAGVLPCPEWDDVAKVLLDLERKQARGNGEPLLDCIVLDDLTEQSALSIGFLSGEGNMDMQKWGRHKIFMSTLYRKVKNVAKNAIFVCRCDWQGDPNQKPDNTTVGDQRDQKMQPILEGAFNGWFRYDVSLLAYQEKEVRGSGNTKYRMMLQPNDEVMVENRLWVGEPRRLEDPTFDQLLAVVREKEEGKKKEGN